MLYANYVREKMRNLKHSRLPKEYQEVKYIESTGTQYIDTGYIANNNSGFKVIIKPKYAADANFIGSRNYNVTNGRFVGGTFTGPSCYIGWNTNTFANWTLNQIHDVENNFLNSKNKKLDNTVIANITENLVEQLGSCYLFAFHPSSSERLYNFEGNMYSCQISEGMKIIRNFIPCYRKSDNVIGMYDLVEGKFYTNAGTGEFIKGGNV